jgi:hypothetical protein
MIRFTVSRLRKHGAEILARDSGPLFRIGDASLTREIEAVLAEHADAIAAGDIEIVIRVASRSFAPTDRPRPAPAPPPYQPRPGRF